MVIYGEAETLIILKIFPDLFAFTVKVTLEKKKQ